MPGSVHEKGRTQTDCKQKKTIEGVFDESKGKWSGFQICFTEVIASYDGKHNSNRVEIDYMDKGEGQGVGED